MKIAVISGSRSDRNALVMVEKALKSSELDARLCEIVIDTRKLTPESVFVQSAEYLLCFSVYHKKWFPDLIVLHGDRHEILGIAAVANVMGVPIAHIGGGDLTEGSQDDCFRHAITKLSHLHFASNQDSADRIVQMGEEPDRVHVTGCPGIDMVVATPVLDRDTTFLTIGLGGLHPRVRSLLVLFHPNTLGDTMVELKALSDALMRRAEALVLLGPNADSGSDLIRREWDRLCLERPDTVFWPNVEPQVFYSLLKWCNALVGNSSAGFYEAPCFGTPVVNIGDRQKGRPSPSNVLFPDVNVEDVAGAIDYVIEATPAPVELRKSSSFGLYGDGHAAGRIAKVVGGIENPRDLLRKRFHQPVVHNWNGKT